MQANPRSIDALFNSQIRYVVPMFQRLYVLAEVPGISREQAEKIYAALH